MKKLIINVMIVACLSVVLSNCKKDDNPPAPKPPEFIIGETAGAEISIQQKIGMEAMINDPKADATKWSFTINGAWMGIAKKELVTITGNTWTGDIIDARKFIFKMGFDSNQKIRETIIIDPRLKDMAAKIVAMIKADTSIHLPEMNFADSLEIMTEDMLYQLERGPLVLSQPYLDAFIIKAIDRNYAYFLLYFYGFLTPDSSKKLSGGEFLELVKVNHPEVYIPSE